MNDLEKYVTLNLKLVLSFGTKQSLNNQLYTNRQTSNSSYISFSFQFVCVIGLNI